MIQSSFEVDGIIYHDPRTYGDYPGRQFIREIFEYCELEHPSWWSDAYICLASEPYDKLEEEQWLTWGGLPHLKKVSIFRHRLFEEVRSDPFYD